ncbi:MAG: phosphotransferase [Lachnospiraceae bacterium]|nr:phosphotransferase [Lachnospiraceae bacterium]
MRSKAGKSLLKIYLDGRIDSSNASSVEKEIMDIIQLNEELDVTFDADGLKYISSAGLRVLLKVRKLKGKSIEITNVSDEVLEIFTTTGFTDLFDITRPMRRIYLERTDVLIRSVNGEIHRQPDDNIVKVFHEGTPLGEIKKERENAHNALVAGIPTLIPFDIVAVGNCYGIVFEAAGSLSLAQAITREPERLGEYAVKFAGFLHELHEIQVGDEFPNIKERYRGWLERAGLFLSDDDRRNINALINGIPDSSGYVHGDINPANVIMSDGEMMLMDMAGSAHGHPIFDLQGLYASLVEIEKERSMYCSSTFGISGDNCVKFWDIFFPAYMGGRSEAELDKMRTLLGRYYVLKQRLLSVLEEKS